MTDKDRIMEVQGIADVSVVTDPELIRKNDSALGKPYLSCKFQNGAVVNISLNLAEMIGGVGKGANLRFGYTTEESYKQRKH